MRQFVKYFFKLFNLINLKDHCLNNLEIHFYQKKRRKRLQTLNNFKIYKSKKKINYIQEKDNNLLPTIKVNQVIISISLKVVKYKNHQLKQRTVIHFVLLQIICLKMLVNQVHVTFLQVRV